MRLEECFILSNLLAWIFAGIGMEKYHFYTLIVVSCIGLFGILAIFIYLIYCYKTKTKKTT